MLISVTKLLKNWNLSKLNLQIKSELHYYIFPMSPRRCIAVKFRVNFFAIRELILFSRSTCKTCFRSSRCVARRLRWRPSKHRLTYWSTATPRDEWTTRLVIARCQVMHDPCLAHPIFLKCENSDAVTTVLKGIDSHDFRSG